MRPILLAVLALAAAACAPEAATSVTLAPTSAELADVLRAADARWEAAGVHPDRIQIGPVGSSEGAPVRLVPERAPVAETRTYKRGSEYAGVRWVELYSLDVDVATHELGHVLGIEWATEMSRHLDGAECDSTHAHTDRAMMCTHVGGAITAADLALACDVGECVTFSPEL